MADYNRWRGDQGRSPAEGRYEDWGGRADRGRFIEESVRPQSSVEGHRGGGGRTGGSSVQHRVSGQSGSDYYSGFYGADQVRRGGFENRSPTYGRGEEQRGYLDSPRSGEWRKYADTGAGQERGLWDWATNEVSSWFHGGHSGGYEGRGEHRGRGPKGYVRSDERIREDVNDRLTEDPYVDASDIEVNVSNREVTLSGLVDSREAKRRAEDIAESVSGVTHVLNSLRVAGRPQSE